MAACAGNSVAGIRPASSIVLSQDDSHLYVADTMNNQVVVVNAGTQQVEKTVAVGAQPERIQVGLDGRLFVSNRQSRSVSVVDPEAGTEITRIAVAPEPLGLAMTDDGATLAVASHTGNSVSLIDTRTLAVVKTIPTRELPVGVAFSNGKLYVTHDRTGLVSVLDPTTGNDLVASPLYLGLNPAQTNGEVRLPGQPADPIVANGHLIVPQVHSKQDPTPTPVGVNEGGYAGGGQVGSVAVVASGIATIDTTQDRVMIGHGLEVFNNSGCGDCGIAPPAGAPTSNPSGAAQPALPPPANTPPAPGANDVEAVPSVILTNISGMAMSGPSGAAVEPSGKYLYVTNMNSSNVAILRTDGATAPQLGSSGGSSGGTAVFNDNAGPVTNGLSNGVLQLVSVGRGPKGIAIPAAGDRAYVYNSHDETISVLGSEGGTIVETLHFAVSKSPLTPEQQLGQQLFFAADDSRMTNPSAGGISCASCHPNGRQDGRTWHFTEGARNTPTLAGRHLVATGPYHWDGTLANPEAFQEIVQNRMGGTGEQGGSNEAPLAASDFNAIFSYLDSLAAPDNPNLEADGSAINADAAARGRDIFNGKALCASCHTPSKDFQDFGFHNVGTENSSETFPMDVNTPPLHGLFYSAPYLHDGSAPTLADRVNNDENGFHGHTSQLTAQEKSDLVEYLKTL